MLWIAERDGVAQWKDPTGVTALTPPAGSKLASEWDNKAAMEFIETPLRNAVQIVSDIHGLKFDLSHLPPEPIQGLTYGQIVVTLNVSGITVENGLGMLLNSADCQARLDGETIVIELQPDHPLAQKP
jgi:hypothetical protein